MHKLTISHILLADSNFFHLLRWDTEGGFFTPVMLGVNNFYHEGGNTGPPLEVEFSAIFIYSVHWAIKITTFIFMITMAKWTDFSDSFFHCRSL